jgi:hypothetical protein
MWHGRLLRAMELFLITQSCLGGQARSLMMST